jgi:hypothetical protein
LRRANKFDFVRGVKIAESVALSIYLEESPCHYIFNWLGDGVERPGDTAIMDE